MTGPIYWPSSLTKNQGLSCLKWFLARVPRPGDLVGWSSFLIRWSTASSPRPRRSVRRGQDVQPPGRVESGDKLRRRKALGKGRARADGAGPEADCRLEGAGRACGACGVVRQRVASGWVQKAARHRRAPTREVGYDCGSCSTTCLGDVCARASQAIGHRPAGRPKQLGKRRMRSSVDGLGGCPS
jgi:hypothetical protein